MLLLVKDIRKNGLQQALR